MQLSLGIITAFLLLLPGFGLYGAIFIKLGNGGMEPIPPKPGSVLTLIIIAIGALVGHLLLSIFVVLNDLWCQLPIQCMNVGFDPDIYRALSGMKNIGLTAGHVLSLLLVNIAISGLVFYLGGLFAKRKITKGLVSRLRYGAMADLIDKIEPENRYATAFVLTKIDRNCKTKDDDIVGYEGLLNDLIYDKSEIQAVHLSKCTAFYLRKEEKGMKKIEMQMSRKKIPYLYIPKEEIRNIAFNIYEDPTTDEK